jgi:ubiquinol-cytochrome c reductase iron-sulfur subunit
VTEPTDPTEQTGESERPVGGEGVPAAAFVIGLAGSAGFVLAYVLQASTQVLGIMVFVMMGGIGVGMVSWAKRYMTPIRPDVEPRGRISSTEEEIVQFAADFNVGEYELVRRSLLTKLMLGAMGAMGLAAVVPFASLGPKPDRSFTRTRWKQGIRLVDADGDLVRAADVNTDAVLTVFPEGDAGDELAQALLIGLQPGRLVPVPGREDWTPQNLGCFSKICTHVGCPVGLYEAKAGELLCPCHQSTFAVYRAAEPVFGPAATPLPQLPLGIDGQGYVVAEGDFSSPPGPAFWNQRRGAGEGET